MSENSPSPLCSPLDTVNMATTASNHASHEVDQNSSSLGVQELFQLAEEDLATGAAEGTIFEPTTEHLDQVDGAGRDDDGASWIENNTDSANNLNLNENSQQTTADNHELIMIEDEDMFVLDYPTGGWRGCTAAELGNNIFLINLDLPNLSVARFDTLMGLDENDKEPPVSDEKDGPGDMWDLEPMYGGPGDAMYELSTENVRLEQLGARLRGAYAYETARRVSRGPGLAGRAAVFGSRRAIQAHTPAAWANFVRANQR